MTRDDLEPFTTDDKKAEHITQELLDAVVVALRRGDRRFADISLHEFELLLADVHAFAERRLHDELRDLVHIDDVLYASGDSE
jgi:hypothetical protein